MRLAIAIAVSVAAYLGFCWVIGRASLDRWPPFWQVLVVAGLLLGVMAAVAGLLVSMAALWRWAL